MNRKKITSAFLVAFGLMLSSKNSYAEKYDINKIPKNLKFCDDEETWPPFILYKGDDKKEVRGYSIDVSNILFKKNNINYEVKMLPWKRCLETNMAGDYDLILNAMLTEKRKTDYFASDVFYSLTPIYFWYGEKNMPPITSSKDLEKYKICGIFGYDYGSFAIDAQKIDQGSKNISSLKEKLINHRCDLAIGHKETLSEQVNTNVVSIFKDPLMKFKAIPGINKIDFSILVTKNKPYSQDLFHFINAQLKTFKNSPADKKLRDTWGL